MEKKSEKFPNVLEHYIRFQSISKFYRKIGYFGIFYRKFQNIAEYFRKNSGSFIV